MIKTVLKHYIVDKFISRLFDDVISKIQPQPIVYSEHDFYISQKLSTITTTHSTYNDVVVHGLYLTFGSYNVDITYRDPYIRGVLHTSISIEYIINVES